MNSFKLVLSIGVSEWKLTLITIIEAIEIFIYIKRPSVISCQSYKYNVLELIRYLNFISLTSQNYLQCPSLQVGLVVRTPKILAMI